MKKIIRDTIYTYIEIEENALPVINLDSFQRLRNIKQLTIQHLYPSANHTRFEHSLGVTHLALSVFERIKADLLDNKKDDLFKEHEGDLFRDQYFLKNHLFYAALLHDVGHAPLSHVGEYFFNKDEILAEIRQELKNNDYKFSVDFLENENIAPHELMSCYVIIKKFANTLKPCYYAVTEKNFLFDFEFIFRIVCGSKYQDNGNDHAIIDIKNTIISIVHSNSIDVDKIDYLLRDNKMVGYIGPQIDVSRLIMSVIIDGEGGLMFTQMGLSALQGLIDCRDNLYLWVFNHHTVVYTDYLYQEYFTHFNNLSAGNKGQFEEEMPSGFLFSCRAIADNCVSDIDALSMINRAYRTVKNGNTLSKYTVRLVNQLMNRNFLKSLWKTLNQYNDFLSDCGYKTIDDHKKLTEYISKKENRIKLIHEITNELNIDLGNLFIVERENKFGEKLVNNLKIKFNGKKESIKKLLPTKNYEERFEKTAFYVYCEEASMGHVKTALKNKLLRMKEQQPDNRQPELL
jgi:HD superfamily phosphohydrolase